MASTCLENLEALNEKGVDMETIYNTAFIVYIGIPRLVITLRAPLIVSCRNVRHRPFIRPFCQSTVLTHL